MSYLICINCGDKGLYEANYKPLNNNPSRGNDIILKGVFCSEKCSDEYWFKNHKDIPQKVGTDTNNDNIITVDKINLNIHPFTKEEMGRTGWTTLHMFANGYPNEPTEEDKNKMKGFLDGFAHHYPCLMCREHFKVIYKKNPPILDSKQTLKNTICNYHNIVNNRLGKLIVPCQYIESELSSYICIDDN
jgi:hypothetical protein